MDTWSAPAQVVKSRGRRQTKFAEDDGEGRSLCCFVAVDSRWPQLRGFRSAKPARPSSDKDGRKEKGRSRQERAKQRTQEGSEDGAQEGTTL